MSTNLSNNTSCNIESRWTAKMVEDYFQEVILTLRKLPPAEVRGYSNFWPDIIHTPNEKIFQEKKPTRVLATPEAVSRLDKTFEWMTWLTIEERKLIWRRAAKMRWKVICRELGYERSTAWRKWNIACNKIAASLNVRKTLRREILQNKKCCNIFVIDKNQNKLV